MNNATRVETKRSKITVTRVYKGEYQKGDSLTAELKQEVVETSFYPSQNFENSLGDNLFDNSDFGVNEGKSFTNKKTLVGWIQVPAGTTVEKLQEIINKLPEACLVEIYANEPILNDNQLRSIESGLRKKDDYAMTQALRYGNNHENAGQLILHEGKVQYRVTVFSKTAREKDDRRGNGNVYIPVSMQEEVDAAIMLDAEQGI